MNDTAIRVEDVSKRYRIGLKEERQDTLMGAVKNLARFPMRSIRRLSKMTRFSDNSYGEEDVIWALRDVSFAVKRGEVVGIIGRNGAGKSTLLKLLSRITYPTTGRMELNGRVSSLLEVGTGFHPELSGRENIYLNGTLLGMRKAEIDRKFEQIVDYSGVEKFIDTPVKFYSSGMRVRLAFSVAAHLEPEILLVDEVLAVGDGEFQKKCLGKMESISQEGRTVLFVSHNMAAIENLCSTGLLLNNGSLILHDEVRNVVNEYLQQLLNKSMININDRADRSGSGDIRFKYIELNDKEGNTRTSFKCGEYANFILHFENKINCDLRNFHLALGIDSQLGQRITIFSTELTNQIIDLVPSNFDRIEIHVENLPLVPGRYQFTIFCTLDNNIADWIKNAGYFDVEAGDFFGTGRLSPPNQGHFLVKHNFKIS